MLGRPTREAAPRAPASRVRFDLDARRIRSYHRAMSMWRCPHCGTPQAETARCWVCRRSSTTCSTCRHYRRSVAAQIGYCGLDRKRRPLAGTELRGCWSAAAARIEPPATTPGRESVRGGSLRLRDFVPVELVARATPGGPVVPVTARTPVAQPAAGSPDPSPAPERGPRSVAAARVDQGPTWSNRVTLFGDADS